MAPKQPKAASTAPSSSITFNPNDLSVNDLVDFEEATGKDLFEVLPTDAKAVEDWRPSAKVMRALLWIARRREQPGLTLLEAGDLTIEEFVLDFGGDEPRPTGGAGSTS
ncbi:MAG TPA: hypothetical protein VG899_12435 [Mycobacteriales bacterium]|nr:hypothetical protein [Mycobacteriales bacterium]